MNENEVVSQWLDPDEVRSLAEGLLAKTPVSQIPSHESVFGENFEGFDGEPNPSDPPLQSIVSEPSSPFSQAAPKPKLARPAVEENKQPVQPNSFYEQKSPVASAASGKKICALFWASVTASRSKRIFRLA